MTRKNILGLIPARGGSKGLAKKNIKQLAGKPLIAWTLESARSSRLLSQYFVSTEDPEIALIAKDHGTQIIDRPKSLSTDDASIFDVIRHAISVVPVDWVVLLQPTNPIRSEDLIDRCIEIFSNSDADSLATGWQCPFLPYGSNLENRQKIPGFFYDDGTLYIFRAENLKQGSPFGIKHERVYLDKEQNVDINDEFDFWLAEQILLKRAHMKLPL